MLPASLYTDRHSASGISFREPSGERVKPVLQALVLAEHVYQDVSGKKIIAGTFNRIRFSRKQPVQEVTLPDGTKKTIVPGGVHGGSPFAYISLTDVVNGTKLTLQFVNLEKNVTLLGTDVVVNCPDRLSSVEMVVPLPPLPVQEAGTYALEVVCDGEIVGSHRINAEEVDLGPSPS